MSQDTADDGDEDFEEPDGDDWILEGDRLIRLHQVLRRRLFVPFSSTAPPCRFGRIRGPRLTMMLLQDGTRREHRDDWSVASRSHKKVEMDFLWTRQTEFELEPARPPQDTQQQHPPQPRILGASLWGARPPRGLSLLCLMTRRYPMNLASCISLPSPVKREAGGTRNRAGRRWPTAGRRRSTTTSTTIS